MVAEVKAFDLIAGTQLLQRRWKIIVAATFVAGIIGVAATRFVPPLYESEVDLQLGTVDGEPVEDGQVLVKVLESAGVTQQWGAADGIRQPVQAQVVESKPGGSVAYIRVLARGRSAEDARRLAAQALDFVKNRHADVARTLQDQTNDYDQTVEATTKQLGESVSSLETLLSQARPGQDASLMYVVLQAQLQARRDQYLQLSKGLRDERLKRARTMKSTKELAPPSTPAQPVWPSRLVFAVVGGGLGLAAAAIWILLFG